MNAFWASENLLAFIGLAPPSQGNQTPKTLPPNAPISWEQTTRRGLG